MSDSVEYKTNNNLSSLRADVTETTNVLKVTIDKLVDRGEKIDELNARAEDLSSSSYHFQGSARRVQRRMKWQSYKMTIIIIVVIIVVIGMIILFAVRPWKKK